MLARTLRKLPVSQGQQVIAARTMYQNPYIARFKRKNEVSPDFHKKVTYILNFEQF